MKRQRSSERKSKSVSKRRRIEPSSDDKQWYEVMLTLAAKSACDLTHAINKSEERRELPTIPQPTHQMEWLARVDFKHRPVRYNVPEQRQHKVSKSQDLNSSFYVY